MAEELRWENLVVSGNSADADNAASFTNNASKTLHIRTISYHHTFTTMAPNERIDVEISKAPSKQMDLNASTFFVYDQGYIGPPTGATPADGGASIQGHRNFAKGQLTLEPGESLHVNADNSGSGPLGNFRYRLGYHY